MDQELRERIERSAEKHALFNALKHDSEADLGAIMGPLMGENPDFREFGDQIPGIIGPIVAAVNDLDRAERRDRLAEIAPEGVEELEREPAEDDHDLPPLPGAEDVAEVRLRCAPNPNGPWHIGHARMGAVIGKYADRYDGWMLCRFDDTDPATKRPSLQAYDQILDDLAYLGFKPDEVLRASDRLELYYEHARDVIELGGAYTCSCPAGEFSERKSAGEACPHRDRPIDESLAAFDRMVAGEFSAGDRVLRIRTDLEAPNPAERDWVAFRMVDEPHPREDAAADRCWPLLDFQSAIDDHHTQITHIIRGKDLQDSVARQGYLYEYLGWEYPTVLHWGRISVDEYEFPLSTSTMGERIEAGDLTGWDDPAAPTLQSLKRRGIRGAAVTDALAELGVSESDVELSMSSIYARNRERIDPIADRYFLVRDGTRLPLVGDVPATAEPPKHPTDEERGNRTIPVGDAVRIEPGDLPAHGERVWLKGLGCVRAMREALELTGDSIEVVRDGDVPVIHWVPAGGAIPVTIRMPTGDSTGLAEPSFAEVDVDDVVQFERVGFARVDSHARDESIVYFAHN